MSPIPAPNMRADIPVLYSFRRCPYAMRARMAIAVSGLTVELRDILLKDKPDEMVSASPKATVPVLVTGDGQILEESLDILHWGLQQSDPEGWLPEDEEQLRDIKNLIAENDGPFKSALDRYKYHVRFPERGREDYRQEGETFLAKLEARLAQGRFLMGETPTVADIAIFPFIRQFANSDSDWFYAAPYPALQKWLTSWLGSEIFLHIMKKRPIWQPGLTGPFFPDLTFSDST
ncbi:MAG: glutathione S-transferase [Sneathiella sp.]